MLGQNFDSETKKAESRSGMFKPNVKSVRLTDFKGSTGAAFRINPAFDYDAYFMNGENGAVVLKPGVDQNTAMLSSVPYKRPDGVKTQWGMYVYCARFVGHNDVKMGGRSDFVLDKTFTGTDDGCAMAELMAYVASNSEWHYLYGSKDEGGDEQSKKARMASKCLPGKPERIMLLNVTEAGQPDVNKIGILSSSAATSLVRFADMVNVGATDEMLAHNYLFKWAVGDLTNPQNAPQLQCAPSPNNKNFVDIRSVVSGDGRQMMMACYPQHLTGRYILVAPETFIVRRTYDATVAELVRVLNGHRPDRQAHEWEMLRTVFGHRCKIPDAPKHTGQIGGMGLGHNPAQQQQPPPQQGFAQFGQPGVAAGQPAFGQPAPQPGFAQAPMPQQFQQQPQQFAQPAAQPQMAPPPTALPPTQFSTPGWNSKPETEEQVPMSGFAPMPTPAAAMQQTPPPAQFQSGGAQVPAAVTAAAQAAQAAHAAQPQTPLPGQAPGAPSGWTKEQFIAKIKADAAAKQK